MILLVLHETEGSETIPNHVDGSRNQLDSLLELGNQVEIFESGIIISTFTFGCLVFFCILYTNPLIHKSLIWKTGITRTNLGILELSQDSRDSRIMPTKIQSCGPLARD